FRKKYGLSGSTLAAAIRFYLEASKFAGVPVGTHFKTPPRPRRGGSTRPAAKKTGSKVKVPPRLEDESNFGGMANTMRIPLSSGGQVILTTSVDVTRLSSADRTFVFGLIDR